MRIELESTVYWKLSFNAEVGLIGNLRENMAQNGLSREVTMAFSGGLRYQFGKREK